MIILSNHIETET